jgi:hypothetical protein
MVELSGMRGQDHGDAMVGGKKVVSFFSGYQANYCKFVADGMHNR